MDQLFSGYPKYCLKSHCVLFSPGISVCIKLLVRDLKKNRNAKTNDRCHGPLCFTLATKTKVSETLSSSHITLGECPTTLKNRQKTNTCPNLGREFMILVQIDRSKVPLSAADIKPSNHSQAMKICFPRVNLRQVWTILTNTDHVEVWQAELGSCSNLADSSTHTVHTPYRG